VERAGFEVRTSSLIATIILGALGLMTTVAMALDNTFPPPQGDQNTVTSKPNPFGGYDFSNGVTSRPNPQGGMDYSNGVSCRPNPQGGMYCWPAQPPPR
jgi:hypothetical protein